MTSQMLGCGTSITTGNQTINASTMYNDNIIIRSSTSATFTDTTDTAANIVAQFVSPQTGPAYSYTDIMLINHTPNPWTINMGAGCVSALAHAGNNTQPIVIAANDAKIYRMAVHNAAAGSEEIGFYGK